MARGKHLHIESIKRSRRFDRITAAKVLSVENQKHALEQHNE